MARASVLQVSNIGVETTPGTAVTANKRLTAYEFVPSINVETSTHRPRGYKFPTLAIFGREHTQLKVSGIADYANIAYLFSCALKSVTPVSQSDAYLWTFTPAVTSGDTVKTLTVATGDANGAIIVPGVTVNSLNIKASRKEVKVEAEAFGMKATDGSLAAATEVVPVPVVPGSADLFVTDSYANIATAKVSDAFEYGFALSDRFAQVWPLDSSKTSWAEAVESAPKGEVKVKVAVGSTSGTLLSAARSTGTLYVRYEATGSAVGSTVYRLTIDTALKVTGVGEYADEDGVYAIEFTGTLVNDSALGGAVKAEVVNGEASL